MTIRRRMKHSVDVNNPTWVGGSKTDSWTLAIAALVSKATGTIRTEQGDLVSASTHVILPAETTITEGSEIRLNGETDARPVVSLYKVRGSREDIVKHIEVYLE